MKLYLRALLRAILIVGGASAIGYAHICQDEVNPFIPAGLLLTGSWCVLKGVSELVCLWRTGRRS
jgi:hypothetical protein